LNEKQVEIGEVYAFKSDYNYNEGKKLYVAKDGDIIKIQEIMVALDGYEYYLTSVPLRMKDDLRLDTIYWVSTEFDTMLKNNIIYLFDETAVLVVDPKNNDDRDTCYSCGAPTKEWGRNIEQTQSLY